MVEIGRDTFAVVMRRIEDLPGIKLAMPEVRDITDLSGVRNLLVYERIQIGEEAFPLAGVARALRAAMRDRPDALMFRRRCQHLPRLYQVLIETLGSWRGLSSVRQRYAEHGEIMERQISRYGEEMMNLYRRVERSP